VVDKELLLSPLMLDDPQEEEGYELATCKVTFGDAPSGSKPKKEKYLKGEGRTECPKTISQNGH
jgi:hypothetical protein